MSESLLLPGWSNGLWFRLTTPTEHGVSSVLVRASILEVDGEHVRAELLNGQTVEIWRESDA